MQHFLAIMFLGLLFTSCNNGLKPKDNQENTESSAASKLISDSIIKDSYTSWHELTGKDGLPLETSNDRTVIMLNMKPFTGKVKKHNDNGFCVFNGEYLAGKLNGECIYYHDNGVKWMEGLYDNSSRIGEWNYFNKDGKLEKVLIYKDGEYIRTIFPKSQG